MKKLVVWSSECKFAQFATIVLSFIFIISHFIWENGLYLAPTCFQFLEFHSFFFIFKVLYLSIPHFNFLPCTCSVSNMSTLELFFSFTYFIVYRHTPEKTEMPNCTMQGKCELEEQGWRSGESARLPPLWLGFDSCPVPFVGLVCCWFSSLFRGFFSVFTGFPPSTKIKTTNLARPG